MKKMWKLNNKAVSPVIATILMVAITVVLAAVLYVMVMGFGGDGGSDTPTGSFTMTEAIDGTHQKVQFGVLSPETSLTELKIIITTTAGSETWTYVSGASLVAPATDVVTTVDAISYVDLAADSTISSGDYLNIQLDAGATGSFTVTMIYTDTGDSIDVITFTK
jgi:flagellin-like protein